MIVHHVALTVADLDRSARWYVDLFGLELVMNEQGETRRAAVYRFPHGPLMLGLVQHGEGDPAAFDPRVTGLDHVAFTVDRRADLDRWVGALDDRSIAHSGVVDVPPGAIVNFRDPDGIQLAFFWDRG